MERLNSTISNLLKRPVFEKGESNWVDILPTISKQNNYRVRSPIKLTPIQAPLEKNEGYLYQNFLDKRRKIKPKFQRNDFVRVADLKKNVPKR